MDGRVLFSVFILGVSVLSVPQAHSYIRATMATTIRRAAIRILEFPAQWKAKRIEARAQEIDQKVLYHLGRRVDPKVPMIFLENLSPREIEAIDEDFLYFIIQYHQAAHLTDQFYLLHISFGEQVKSITRKLLRIELPSLRRTDDFSDLVDQLEAHNRLFREQLQRSELQDNPFFTPNLEKLFLRMASMKESAVEFARASLDSGTPETDQVKAEILLNLIDRLQNQNSMQIDFF